MPHARNTLTRMVDPAARRTLRARIGRRLGPGLGDKTLYRLGLRSASTLTLPDFLGIGAQKAGTTWLHANLLRHPDLFLPREQKELHYFDEQWRAPLASYAARFAEAGARVKGEITPAYAVLPLGRIRFIARVMPDLRLVLLVRDPVERAWSQAYMNLVQGRDGGVDAVPEDAFVAHFRSTGSVTRGDYLRVIEHWTSVFPAERLLVGFHEELRDDPKGLLARVFAHIGVTSDVDWARFPLSERILPHQAPEAAPAIPPRLEAFLRDFYRDDVRRLADALGGYAARWGA